jgi:hypothetical protein
MNYIVTITQIHGATFELEADSQANAEEEALELAREQNLPVGMSVIECHASAEEVK